MRIRKTGPALSIALAALLAPALTGCFGNPLDGLADRVSEGLADELGKKIEESIEGGTGGELDLDLEEGLPQDFPEDEVPLVDGEVLGGVRIVVEDKPNWQVSVRVADEAAVEQGKRLLEDAGYTAAFATDFGAMYENDKYGVIYGAGAEDGGFVISYVVNQK